MQIDAFQTNGVSPPAAECAMVGCDSRTDHNPLPDFLLANHGSLFLLQPVTDSARAWVDEHLPPDALRFGGSVVIEPRYVAAIVVGIRADGMRVR